MEWEEKRVLKIKALAITVCILAVWLAGCKKEPHVEVKRRKVKAETATVKRLPVLKVREFPGRTKAEQTATLSSKTSGTVKRILVDEGRRVKKGQLLLEVDDSDIKARITAVERGIKALLMKKKALTAKFEYIKKNFHRYKALLKEEAVTKEEFDRIKSQYLATQKEIRSLDYEIKRMKSEKNAVSSLLKYTKIRAPFDGVVSKKFVDEGTFVAPGMPLLAVNSDKGFTLFVTNVDESLIDSVKKQEEIPVFIKALNRTYSGRVHSISSVDPKSSTFRLKLKLSEKLPSGLFGRAFIPQESSYSVVVPEKAIVQRGNLKAVYTVDPQNIIHFQVIRCGSVYERTKAGLVPLPLYSSLNAEGKELMIEVLAGLKEGEKIVVSNTENVREGDELE